MKIKFTKVQEAALSLMHEDLRFLYTVIKNIDSEESNYIPSLQPYMGVIIDGVEDWIKSFNNSSKVKLDMPIFNELERQYYEKMRDSVKMWQKDYNEIYNILKKAYEESDRYFGSVCKPIAKTLKLYDIYGVDRANGIICGNTILCFYYNPLYSFEDNGEFIKTMAEIGGKYIALMGAVNEYTVNDSIKFDTKDYGGFQKSPIGNKFSDKFVLFSILCQINFLIYGVERWIKEETPTKLRFMYLLYYSLLELLPQINQKLNTAFKMDCSWESRDFRNSMAHYKLGVALKKEELVLDDLLFGLTIKYFGVSYIDVKNVITAELENLSHQIEQYLHLK